MEWVLPGFQKVLVRALVMYPGSIDFGGIRRRTEPLRWIRDDW